MPSHESQSQQKAPQLQEGGPEPISKQKKQQKKKQKQKKQKKAPAPAPAAANSGDASTSTKSLRDRLKLSQYVVKKQLGELESDESGWYSEEELRQRKNEELSLLLSHGLLESLDGKIRFVSQEKQQDILRASNRKDASALATEQATTQQQQPASQQATANVDADASALMAHLRLLASREGEHDEQGFVDSKKLHPKALSSVLASDKYSRMLGKKKDGQRFLVRLLDTAQIEEPSSKIVSSLRSALRKFLRKSTSRDEQGFVNISQLVSDTLPRHEIIAVLQKYVGKKFETRLGNKGKIEARLVGYSNDGHKIKKEKKTEKKKKSTKQKKDTKESKKKKKKKPVQVDDSDDDESVSTQEERVVVTIDTAEEESDSDSDDGEDETAPAEGTAAGWAVPIDREDETESTNESDQR